MRIAIVGTAGRDKAVKLTEVDYANMIDRSLDYIYDIAHGNVGDVVLVSGGAAWADHVAVHLHLYKNFPLELHIPAPWDKRHGEYLDNGAFGAHDNPGGLSNWYHRRFTKALESSDLIKRSSLTELHEVIYGKAHVFMGEGFFDRNSKVAQVDHLIAHTMGQGTVPKDGGTKDTWLKAKRHGAILKHFTIKRI